MIVEFTYWLMVALAYLVMHNQGASAADPPMLRDQMPKSCRIDVVIDSVTHGPLTYGYDTSSRTWYYVAFGATAACIDGANIEHWRGNSEMRKLLGTTCNTPGFYRYSLPLPWILDALAVKEVKVSSPAGGGLYNLDYTAPGGHPLLIGANSGLPDVSTTIEITETGSVIRWGEVTQQGLKWTTPKLIAQPAPGVDVFALHDDWKVRSATVGVPKRITRVEFEAKAREFLSAHSEDKYAKAKGNQPVEVVRVNEMPDTSSFLGDYPVHEKWTSTWGPAVVASGCTIAAIAGIFAWRHRRAT